MAKSNCIECGEIATHHIAYSSNRIVSGVVLGPYGGYIPYCLGCARQIVKNIKYNVARYQSSQLAGREVNPTTRPEAILTTRSMGF